MRGISLADQAIEVLSCAGERNPGSRIFFLRANFPGDRRYRTQVTFFE